MCTYIAWPWADPDPGQWDDEQDWLQLLYVLEWKKTTCHSNTIFLWKVQQTLVLGTNNLNCRHVPSTHFLLKTKQFSALQEINVLLSRNNAVMINYLAYWRQIRNYTSLQETLFWKWIVLSQYFPETCFVVIYKEYHSLKSYLPKIKILQLDRNNYQALELSSD